MKQSLRSPRNLVRMSGFHPLLPMPHDKTAVDPKRSLVAGNCDGEKCAAYTLQRHHPELDAPGVAANLREAPGAVPVPG